MSQSEAGPPPSSPSGLLLIDKHRGPTSMQVCAAIRARLRRAGAPKRVKVGHAGTLDPMATGLLVVMVGKATSLCERFMGQAKEYVTTIDLSRVSTTDDAEGDCTQVIVDVQPARTRVDAALAGMVGIIMQRPPAFSAISVGGRRAYDLARSGQAIELPARPVTINAIDVLEYTWPLLTLRIACGKGTYIRSIARDLGVTLGTGGMLTSLRRTASGNYRVEHARTLADLPERLGQQDLMPMV